MHKLYVCLINYSGKVVPQFPYLSRQRLIFPIAKRFSTIEDFCSYINHHIPTTFGFHGKMFGNILEYSLIYTMISATFLPSQDIHIYVPIPANLRFFYYAASTVVYIRIYIAILLSMTVIAYWGECLCVQYCSH